MSLAENDVWFITGTNRGIGLEMTRQLLRSPTNTIIAACRNPANASVLKALANDAKGKLYVVTIDTDDKQSIRACVDEVTSILGDKGIDYLINNAGINISPEDSASTLNGETMQKLFWTNVVGPAYVTQAFIQLLRKSKKKTLVNISSMAGSIGKDFGTPNASYAISKTALNMLTYKQAKEFSDVTVISMCPGWLQTDMGGPNWQYPVDVGVEGVLKVIASLTPEKSGSFFNWQGTELPW